MPNLDKAREAKQKKKVFESDKYTISLIPLNYVIEYHIKVENSKGEQVKLIPQNQYSEPDRGLDYAKETAEYWISRYMHEYKVNPLAKQLLS